ncbi:MAG: hypothetical protein ABEK50_10135 [bacterium]
MTPDTQPTFPRTLIVSLLVAGLYVGIHYIPYRSIYVILNDDYHNVIPVINVLAEPRLYSSSTLVRILKEIHLTSSPFYYFGLAYPLAQFLHASTVMKLLGFVACLWLFYFAGFRWRNPGDVVRAFFLLLIALHATPFSIMEGNRRSFRAVFYVGLLWSEERNSFTSYLILLAAATGIYPPAAVVLLGYRWVDHGLQSYRNGTKITDGLLKPFLSLGVFTLCFSPYLWSKLAFEVEFTNSISKLNYSWISFREGFEYFVYGNGNSQFITASVTLSLLGLLCLGQILLLGLNDIRIRQFFPSLILTCVLLWGSAHLTYPLLYQPSRYALPVFLIVAGIFFLDNLTRLLKYFRNLDAEVAGTAGGIVAIILFGSLYYPHCLTDCTQPYRNSQFKELYRTVERTPANTAVVGPPQWMDSVLAFGKRRTFFNLELSDIPMVCSRIRRFTRSYFSSDAKDMLNFMQTRDLDLLLVDRHVFEGHWYTSCGLNINQFESPALNRTYDQSLWNWKDKLFLLTRKQLRKQT